MFRITIKLLSPSTIKFNNFFKRHTLSDIKMNSLLYTSGFYTSCLHLNYDINVVPLIVGGTGLFLYSFQKIITFTPVIMETATDIVIANKNSVKRYLTLNTIGLGIFLSPIIIMWPEQFIPVVIAHIGILIDNTIRTSPNNNHIIKNMICGPLFGLIGFFTYDIGMIVFTGHSYELLHNVSSYTTILLLSAFNIYKNQKLITAFNKKNYESIAYTI